MTCRELADFILDYLSGELPPGVAREFERHLDECPNCVHYLRNYEDAVRAGRAAYRDADEDVQADVPEELVQAILEARRLDRG